MGPRPGPDGRLALTFPLGDKKMAGVAARDIGRVAYGIFKRGLELAGQRIGVAGEHLSGSEMARILGEALGREVVYHEVSPEAYRRLGFPGADDLGNMFQAYRDLDTHFS
ncbi:HSCARG protein [Deinococcus aerius]|uniref:HSCARG protein n=1 Tax=Deinococcus aerius TaxID=200253 RepID=A0A2I9D7L2_9DEIO|nr:NmrA family NAD(P)-binding protein [Deinococcus aerius]GBF06756.1 HSCARG protein [Deinococcus aerius]